VRYNLLNRAPEKEGLSKVAEERGVKLVAYAPYAEGQLVGKTDDAKVRALCVGVRVRVVCMPPLNGDGERPSCIR